MQTNIATFADYVTQAVSGLCIIGQRNVVASLGFPAMVPNLFFVASMELDPTECGRAQVMRLELIDEDGKTIFKSPEMPMTVIEHKQLHRGFANVVIQMSNMRFEKPGIYSATIWQGERMIKDVPLLLATNDQLKIK